MPIVGGLDIHRRQITFDYLDTVTGQVCRGQIAPADREHLRAWLARFAGRDDVAFAVEGCAGWRYVAEELAAAGIAAHLAEPADTAARRGRKRHAKTDKTDARHLRMLLAEGRLPECWIPPGRILECRALLELYTDLRRERTAWAQRIHAVLFHQGAPVLDQGALRTEQGVAALRAAAAAHLSPAGQLQVATAAGGDRRAGGPAARGAAPADLTPPGTWPGPRSWPPGCTGSGRSPRWRSPAGWPGQAGSPPPARRSGSPGWTSPSPPRTARARPGGCPGRDRRCCAGPSTRPARPTPAPRPPTTGTTPGEGPQEQQARLPVRGPQDPPPGPSHPGRARRRRARRRLTHPPW